MTSLRVSLLDNVVTCLDVNVAALMYWHVMSLYVKVSVSLLEHEMTHCMLMLMYVCIIY